jgi:hypothetical protein
MVRKIESLSLENSTESLVEVRCMLLDDIGTEESNQNILVENEGPIATWFQPSNSVHSAPSAALSSNLDEEWLKCRRQITCGRGIEIQVEKS